MEIYREDVTRVMRMISLFPILSKDGQKILQLHRHRSSVCDWCVVYLTIFLWNSWEEQFRDYFGV